MKIRTIRSGLSARPLILKDMWQLDPVSESRRTYMLPLMGGRGGSDVACQL